MLLWRHFIISLLGIWGIHATVEKIDDGYIGCYEYLKGTVFNYTTLRRNSGTACKKYCFPKYRYAGTEFWRCYCGNSLVGNEVDDTKCIAICPNPFSDAYTCGAPYKLTMYNITDMKTPETTPSSIPLPVSSTAAQYNTNSPNVTAVTPIAFQETTLSLNIIWYGVIPFVAVSINIIIVGLLIYRRIKKRKSTQRSITPVDVNNSTDEQPSNTNELPRNTRTNEVVNSSDDADNSYYDTTPTYKSQLQWKKNNRNHWPNKSVVHATTSGVRSEQCQTVPAALNEDNSDMIRTVNEQTSSATRNKNVNANLKSNSYHRKNCDKSLSIKFSTGNGSMNRNCYCNCNEEVQVTLHNMDTTSR